MRNLKLGLYLMIGLTIIVTFGCTTFVYDTSSLGAVQNIQLGVKDFDVIGPIRVVVQREKNFSENEHNGYITYDRLLTEAYKLGADDIINIRIDTTNEYNSGSGASGNIYTINALAIKYTKSLSVPSDPYWNTDIIPEQTYKTINRTQRSKEDSEEQVFDSIGHWVSM